MVRKKYEYIKIKFTNPLTFFFIILISLGFASGIFYEKYHINSYEKISIYIDQFIRKKKKPKKLNLASYQQIHIKNLVRPKIYVTYGQSNSGNYGQYGYRIKNKVYMFFNGKIYSYQDPSLGAEGNDGSVWGRVGDEIIEEGLSKEVLFANTGTSSATIKELSYGKNFKKFKDVLVSLKTNFGSIDGILIQQGEGNHFEQKGSKHYKKEFLIFQKKIRKYSNAPLYLSQSSICQSESDLELLKKQNQVIVENKMVLRGPNTDSLSKPKYRVPDDCHFSEEGLNSLSKLWVEAIKNSSEK